jgi:hypothetical protein
MYRKHYDTPPIMHHAILQALDGSQNGVINFSRPLHGHADPRIPCKH